jgi:hypothetical protein
LEKSSVFVADALWGARSSRREELAGEEPEGFFERAYLIQSKNSDEFFSN